ncbi:MAG: ABC transporter substrate binding protein, partial [Syntrophobacteraceae bacterium]
MELWVGAINLGLLYAFMTVGVFITYRIHNFPDITVDGSFTAGAATAAILILHGAAPLPASLAGFCAGAVAGALTGIIHVRLNIGGMLAGILVMTAFYSINLHIMGRSNIPLLNGRTIVSHIQEFNPGMHEEVWLCLVLTAGMVLFWLAASLFFKTDLGLAMRTTGNNPVMAAATGLNVDRMKVFGVALANGLTGLSGAFVAQYQGFADIGMGIGTVVIGLATVIIGESVLRGRSIQVKILSVILGSLIFRIMIAMALNAGMNPIDLKLMTAFFVLATLIFSKVMADRKAGSGSLPGTFFARLRRRPGAPVFAGGILLLAAGLLLMLHTPETATPPARSAPVKIGVVQLTEHPMLNATREGFVQEMKKLGYTEENCRISLENANGDMPTVNTILDNFLLKKMDAVITISTGCTQAGLKKIKDRPLIFATVADPFKLGAGTSDRDHPPNVTGVYGLAP